MKRIYKNWTFHNIIAHPFSEIMYLIFLRSAIGERICNYIHDITIPENSENGRG